MTGLTKVSNEKTDMLLLSPGLQASVEVGEGNGNPLQYSCLENPMDREAWWATVHGVTKSWMQLSTQRDGPSYCG